MVAVAILRCRSLDCLAVVECLKEKLQSQEHQVVLVGVWAGKEGSGHGGRGSGHGGMGSGHGGMGSGYGGRGYVVLVGQGGRIVLVIDFIPLCSATFAAHRGTIWFVTHVHVSSAVSELRGSRCQLPRNDSL